jgi:hypothetical protein
MKGKRLGGLIALNVVLLAALALFSFFGPSAQAQLGAQQRGDYLMVGYAPGRESWNAVIITDLNSGNMLAVRYHPQKKNFEPLAFINISAAAAAAK